MNGEQQAVSGEITKYTQAQQTEEKLIGTQLRSMKGRFPASLALLSVALLLTGKASRSLTLMSCVHSCPMLQSIRTRPNHLIIHSLSLFYNPIAASPIIPRRARQSGDDTDSGCGQTPAGRDGRDGLPGPPGPQGLAGTATDH